MIHTLNSVWSDSDGVQRTFPLPEGCKPFSSKAILSIGRVSKAQLW